MRIRELYEILNGRIPSSLSCEWDNDGLMCCPDPEKEVKKVLLTLDVTDDAVQYAAKAGCDLVVSHHPLVFHPLRRVTDPRLMTLIRNGISVFSFHTRLDSVSGGVNDRLAALLSLHNAEPFGDGMGRVGELDSPMTPERFGEYVRRILGAPAIRMAGVQKPVLRVAVLGGSGGDMVQDAVACGADAYVSGEFSHHHFTDAAQNGILLVEAGHFHTENPVLSVLREMILSAGAAAEILEFSSDPVRVITD